MPSVMIIGRADAPEFAVVVDSLQGSGVERPEFFRSLPLAIRQIDTQQSKPELVIVLQSWSDEFAADDVRELLGLLLFGRVLCCYSPWCLSDGRSRDIWPVSVRVPLSSARSAVQFEIENMNRKLPPLLPMAAAEEVFAYRSTVTPKHIALRQKMVWILSAETAFSGIVEQLCRCCGCQTMRHTLCPDSLRHALESLPHPDLLLIDFDPVDDHLRATLRVLDEFLLPVAVLGMSVFPFAQFADFIAECVVSKTEFYDDVLPFLISDNQEPDRFSRSQRHITDEHPPEL